MASLLSPLRSVASRSAGRVFRAQRRLTELQLAQARVAERQVISWFELYRSWLEAGLRFSEVAAETLAPSPTAASSPPAGTVG
ncbi:MAG: hypothetical protein Q8P41_02800 [Pseudomonadota bacterium]|nr:hypothetical protein [Pseudomonadota bacterium]